jgi:hypothetical protein
VCRGRDLAEYHSLKSGPFLVSPPDPPLLRVVQRHGLSQANPFLIGRFYDEL